MHAEVYSALDELLREVPRDGRLADLADAVADAFEREAGLRLADVERVEHSPGPASDRQVAVGWRRGVAEHATQDAQVWRTVADALRNGWSSAPASNAEATGFATPRSDD